MMGRVLKRRMKVLFLALLGAYIFTQFSVSFILIEPSMYVILFLELFTIYSYLIYHLISRKIKPKYPLAPPRGKVDIYLPRTKHSQTNI